MRTIILLIAFVTGLSSFAFHGPTIEKPGTITGTVIDKKLQAPLPYVSVVVKNMNNEIITGGITSETGTFEISGIPKGKSRVSVQFVGYTTYTTEITISAGHKHLELGTIYLEENVAALDEVVVIAESTTIEQKIDRKVIHVGKDLATAGASASEIMNKLPSVGVDQQTGNISLRGNANVRVMVDGKLSNIPAAQLLKQIPSTSIKTIELITNPSAKYNPEGMSGIINIVLYKNTKMGVNGSISTGLTQAEHTKFNGSANINYRNGKFNLYGSYGSTIAKSNNNGTIFRPSNNSTQLIDILNDRKSHLFKVGMDFYLNEKNTLSFYTNQNIYDGNITGSVAVIYPSDNSLNQTQFLLAANENNASQYNFDYLLKFDKEGHNIELEADYNRYNSDETAQNEFSGASPIPNYADFVDTDRNRLTVNLDYVNPLTESSELEAGVQARLFQSKIGFVTTGLSYNPEGELTSTPNTNFDYSRDIYSVYATYKKEYDHWGYQVGARVENVEVLADTNQVNAFTNNYLQIYPSAYVTYTPSKKNNYQLSYSRRVDRPGLSQVNPIREFTTPLLSKFGNPNLRPQFTHSIETNYTRDLGDGNITASIFYRAIKDEINQGFFIDRTNLNRTILTFDNFSNTSAYGFEISGNYRPTDWWSFNGSFDLYNSTQKGIAEKFNNSDNTPSVDDIIVQTEEVESTSYSFKMNHNFKATKKLTFSIFGYYKGEEEGVQFKSEPMYFVNIGARYSLWDGRGTLSLNYNDIFNTMHAEFRGNYPYPQVGEFHWESNSIKVGFSYRFGGNKYRAKTRKKREDNVQSGGGGMF